MKSPALSDKEKPGFELKATTVAVALASEELQLCLVTSATIAVTLSYYTGSLTVVALN